MEIFDLNKCIPDSYSIFIWEKILIYYWSLIIDIIYNFKFYCYNSLNYNLYLLLMFHNRVYVNLTKVFQYVLS